MVRADKLIFTWLPIILILSTIYSHEVAFVQTKDPREEDLIIKFCSNIEAAYVSLKAGDIDIIGYDLTPDLVEDAQTDSNIVLSPVNTWLGMYQLDINNNYTMPSQQNIRSPTNYKGFRQALACLVDKDTIVQVHCEGYAYRIDQPIGYGNRGWRNESYWYEDGTYPYKYNFMTAAATFDGAGFVQGSDSNPDYNTGVPGSAEYLRIHPETGTTMDLLEVCVRSDDDRRLQAGRDLCDNLRLLGIPVNQVEADTSVLYPKVMDNFDFHVYTGSWSGGRFPGPTIYGLYHHDSYVLGGANYITGVQQNGEPNYPILNEMLKTACFPDDYDEAASTTKKALGYLVEECITISLFSPRSFWASRANVLGIVNAESQGLENSYTFLNAFKDDGSPIRYGLKTPPNAFNKVYSTWFYDHQVLKRMDLYTSKDIPPYDFSSNQGGYILNWSINSWVDPDDALTKTKITQTHRSDAWFVEPVTGNQLEHVNATHHYTSIWYDYQLSDSWNHDNVADIKTMRIIGPNTIEIYWNISSYWTMYQGATYLKSFNWWSKGTLSQTTHESLIANISTGFVTCTDPVFYVLNASVEGTPLQHGIDYDIYMDPDGPHNADVRIMNALYFNKTVDLTYLATYDAHGFYPSGLPWQDCFEGAGMYYTTDFAPPSYIAMKRNPYYPMKTPLLGEVDFVKKDNGCYKIDIFDVVIAATTYGSQGVGVPDSDWFAGADLAYPGGQIDIFDVVTVASNYGKEWDCYT